MLRRCLFIINSTLLLMLCGCTDVRERLSPDVLAVDLRRSGAASFAACCTQSGAAAVRAEGESPLTLCTALRAAAGKEIDAGHLSLLLLRGDPAAVLPDYLAMQVLMPTSAVLLCRSDPCRAPETMPDAAQLRAAVEAGMLPARTADLILGDLQNGSGVSAIPYCMGSTLTLALCGIPETYPVLTEDACRGLALLGNRWTTFSFRAGEDTVSAVRTHLRITASEGAEGTLHFRLSGKVICRPEGIPSDGWLAAAQSAAERMLTAGCREPLEAGGADLLLLRETAVRDGISDAAGCTNAAWRERLLHADFTAEITAEADPFAGIG